METTAGLFDLQQKLYPVFFFVFFFNTTGGLSVCVSAIMVTLLKGPSVSPPRV